MKRVKYKGIHYTIDCLNEENSDKLYHVFSSAYSCDNADYKHYWDLLVKKNLVVIYNDFGFITFKKFDNMIERYTILAVEELCVHSNHKGNGYSRLLIEFMNKRSFKYMDDACKHVYVASVLCNLKSCSSLYNLGKIYPYVDIPNRLKNTLYNDAKTLINRSYYLWLNDWCIYIPMYVDLHNFKHYVTCDKNKLTTSQQVVLSLLKWPFGIGGGLFTICQIK
jgi:hypothetical protein